MDGNVSQDPVDCPNDSEAKLPQENRRLPSGLDKAMKENRECSHSLTETANL